MRLLRGAIPLDCRHPVGAIGSGGVKLRSALPSDAALLRDWESRPHVRAAVGGDAGFDWETELRRDPDRRHKALLTDGQRIPIG